MTHFFPTGDDGCTLRRVTARTFVRKMRGGSQAHLLEVQDGQYYVVKLFNNPQHRRVLVNEVVSSFLFEVLGLAVPLIAAVTLPAGFVADNPKVGIETPHCHILPSGGPHFGSRYPGNPARLAVYDFLPTPLFCQLLNFDHFLGAFVTDRWLGNTDARQAVFFRGRSNEWLPHAGTRTGLIALMIDHGFAFGGLSWTFEDSPARGRMSYQSVPLGSRPMTDFEPWLEKVTRLPEETILAAGRRIPDPWLAGDEAVLGRLLEQLSARRRRLPDLVRDSLTRLTPRKSFGTELMMGSPPPMRMPCGS